MLNANRLEQLANWCLKSDALAIARDKARNKFFDAADLTTIRYMEGSGDVISRERRFMGWFALTFVLPDGRKPAEVAAAALLNQNDLSSAIDSIKRSRFVLAVVSMIIPGKSLILKVEDEEFTVDNHYLSLIFNSDKALCTHIVPIVRNTWLIGPGWLELPLRIMPGMQANLKQFQLDPIELERVLQRRTKSSEHHHSEFPNDSSFKDAVARMSKEAAAVGRLNLIMTQAQWKKLVVPFMKSNQANDFSREIIRRVGKADSIEEINKWLGLAMNIWNNTPQPDRGGNSAREIVSKYGMKKAG
jgi:hypothetical protein